MQFPFRDASLEASVEFAQNVIKTMRSIRADYMLVPKMKIESEFFTSLCCLCVVCMCCLISRPPPYCHSTPHPHPTSHIRELVERRNSLCKTPKRDTEGAEIKVSPLYKEARAVKGSFFEACCRSEYSLACSPAARPL